MLKIYKWLLLIKNNACNNGIHSQPSNFRFALSTFHDASSIFKSHLFRTAYQLHTLSIPNYFVASPCSQKRQFSVQESIITASHSQKVDTNSKSRSWSKIIPILRPLLKTIQQKKSFDSQTQLLNHYTQILKSSLKHFHGLVDVHSLTVLLKDVQDAYFAIAFYEWFKSQSLFSGDCISYSAIIRICGRAKLFDQMEKYVKEMKQKKIDMDVIVFTELIRCYGLANQIEKSLQWFEKMKKQNVLPNASTYRALIHSMFKQGRNRKAIELFKEMKNKNISLDPQTLSVAISLYGRVGRLDEIYSLYDHLKQSEMKTDLFLLNTLMDVFVKAGEFKKAVEVYDDDVISKGLRPTAVTFNILLHTICALGYNKDAVRSLEKDMMSLNIPPNEVWYNTLIDRHVKDGRLHTAEKVYEEMKLKSILPNVITLNILILGCLNAGMYDKAFDLIHEMKEMNVSSNLNTHIHVLHFYNVSVADEKKTIWKLLTQLNHPMHELFNVLVQSDPRTNVFSCSTEAKTHLNPVWSMERETRHAFVDALIEFMVVEKLYVSLEGFWYVSKPVRFGNSRADLPNRHWKLDLHGFSLITAFAVLRMELLSLYERIVLNKSPFPKKMTIITGKSEKKSMDDATVLPTINSSVGEYLKELDSPFTTHFHNPGRYVCYEPEAFKKWVGKPEVLSKLRFSMEKEMDEVV